MTQALSRAAGIAIWLAVCFPAESETNAGTPLPPVEQVIQRAVEKAQLEGENDRLFNERYFYTRTKVTEFLNNDGTVSKSETHKVLNDPDRRRKRHPVPQPVVAATPAASLGAGEKSPDTKSVVRGKAFHKKDFLGNPELLDRFNFVLTGRETLNGRDTLVIDFKPKPGKLPEHSLKERFINHAAGRVWLDEADAQLAKADLHLTKKVDVFGGLVGSVWKFTCSINRERTDDGLWFTRSSKWHLEGREVVIHRIVDYHDQTEGVRRAP
jgi:hypothetical protein